ncbi:MAG: hypothetical protein A3H96_11650 [Acidobacteria bacterium RIFCSPLOWO2_02_FULL_67_36]|nr:MAG: hypothetical protein A3H96_11650 [Acidobacteria bacterium RIFCSPLOWO2_02_FULL_67_36]OFW20855.1 MAG: hypothetical protein A3G21_18900 [Acidobacteria bacterium RIFCSPLOWO2_12_FULL_66_21]
MYEDLDHRYRQWRAADEDGRDEDADAAFGVVFGAVPEPAVSQAFTAATMARIADVAVREARAAKQRRRAVLAGGFAAAVVSVYFGAGLLVSGLSAIFGKLFDVFVALTVRTADGVQAGAGAWNVLASLGRALGAFVADPAVTFGLIAIQGVAIAALVTLQRLLGSEEDSFK